MVTGFSFLSMRSLKGLFRQIIRKSRRLEREIPSFEEAEAKLAETKTEGAPSYGNTEVAHMAVSRMITITDEMVGNAETSVVDELIGLHRVGQQARELDTELGSLKQPITHFALRRGMDIFQDSGKKLNSTIRDNRIMLHQVLERIKTVSRYFSTTTQRRSAIQAKALAFDVKDAVGKFSTAKERAIRLTKQYAKSPDEKLGNQLAEEIRSAADALMEISVKVGAGLKQEILVLFYINDCVVNIAEELRVLEQKGFSKEKLLTLQKQLAKLQNDRIKKFQGIAAMGDWQQYHETEQFRAAA